MDAKRLNIKNNEKIKVCNNRGEIFIKTKVDFGIKEGCVSISNGWWMQDGANPNFLSKERETDMGFGTAFHDNVVRVEKTELS